MLLSISSTGSFVVFSADTKVTVTLLLGAFTSQVKSSDVVRLTLPLALGPAQRDTRENKF